MTELRIITASTRPGRVGPAVSAWLEALCASLPSIQARVLDLAAYDFPIFDEPKHPRLGQYEHALTRRWANDIASADAFVFVLPEYDHMPPASLINAITYLSKEWQYKPAGLVSYGGLSAGLRAAQAVKPMLAALKMVPLVESVAIPMIADKVSNGVLENTQPLQQAAEQMLIELQRWSGALKTLR
ncbi:NADPH-dependent FMN reductase [Bordetella avium]|uniref:NADPH-dependent FMN reductase n=1 Tax=Bordetella avium TaxID=521 RepID=UPI000E0AB9A7|nr:NAD(P)H-dependent oxidoreductase [Bordetella avium]AZY51088.1 NADPH-dependent FMN reductase [Bordetella avium]RIQ15056.1 NADPH-dependent oxidoreductase [Bordetella avium]RIQ54947.1 NADPH-dependent oxidoreductase [Bordetella avium]RIQ63758.1 NADPH-dependent oxidoreductase [Bordetella avium]RIQ64068.1 NADPH-dependent oxidoreductase [Bordetella avium]